jgi:voltage-gated potassium channel
MPMQVDQPDSNLYCNQEQERIHSRLRRQTLFLRFNAHFWQIIWRVKAIIAVLLLFIVVGAFLMASIEQLPFGEAIYFSFITGLTIGYGDIAPGTPTGRIISILLGVNGILFTGLVVAAAVHALERAVKDVYGHK